MSKRKSLDEKSSGKVWKKYSDLTGFCKNVTLDRTGCPTKTAELLIKKSMAIIL